MSYLTDGRACLAFALIGLLTLSGSDTHAEEIRLRRVLITSSADGSKQPTRVWAPADTRSRPAALLVFLHSWSADFRQDKPDWLQEAADRDWVFLQPNFRGPNDRPEACGSALARQDILDAVDWATDRYRIDPSRIYLAGASGGGHMAMLMASRHPDRFSAVSAWVGISDLADWYQFHSDGETPGRYAQMVAASCGGRPGDSAAVDLEYRERSPIFWLHGTGDLPLDLSAGVYDGQQGSVPFAHSIRAFNVIAKAQNAPEVSPAEVAQLQETGYLEHPLPQDTVEDPTYGREIRLRRTAGPSRLTIFDGGHEGLPTAACAWLEGQQRKVVSAMPRR